MHSATAKLSAGHDHNHEHYRLFTRSTVHASRRSVRLNLPLDVSARIYFKTSIGCIHWRGSWPRGRSRSLQGGTDAGNVSPYRTAMSFTLKPVSFCEPEHKHLTPPINNPKSSAKYLLFSKCRLWSRILQLPSRSAALMITGERCKSPSESCLFEALRITVRGIRPC